MEALSDAQVVAPAALTVDLHSADHRNSFLYVFDYQTKNGDYPQVSTAFNSMNFVNFPLGYIAHTTMLIKLKAKLLQLVEDERKLFIDSAAAVYDRKKARLPNWKQP